MEEAKQPSDVYSLGMLLSLRTALAADGKCEPLVKLMKLPDLAWQPTAGSQSRQRSQSRQPFSSQNARHVTTTIPEVTEMLPMVGDALQQWVHAALPDKRRKLEATTGSRVSERTGVRGKRYLVVSGSHLAVEQALPALEALLQEGEVATTLGSITPTLGGLAGQEILSMVKIGGAPSVAPQSEPRPLSKDEFLVCAIEARESAEIGADAFNSDTFGETHGWSHEENVAANRKLVTDENDKASKEVAAATPVLSTSSKQQDAHFVDSSEALPRSIDSDSSAGQQPPAVQLPPGSDQRPPSTDQLSPTVRVHRPPPPPVPAWAQPPSSAPRGWNKAPPAPNHVQPGNFADHADPSPSLSASVSPTRVGTAPEVTKENPSLLEEWACSACTLLNARAEMKCSICQNPRLVGGAPGVPFATRRAAFAKEAHAAKSKKRGKPVELADPLPQRNAAPRPPPRMLTAGLVVAGSSSANTASGSRWAERPVERLGIGHGSCSWEAEDEDPSLAQYVWNRQLDRPKVDRRQPMMIIPKWSCAN